MVDAVKKFVSQASCALFRQSDAVNDTVLLEFDLDNVRIVPLFQLPLDDSHILHVGVRVRTFRRMTAASIPRLVKEEDQMPKMRSTAAMREPGTTAATAETTHHVAMNSARVFFSRARRYVVFLFRILWVNVVGNFILRSH